MAGQINHNTVPVILEGVADYDVACYKFPVTVIQVTDVNDTAFSVSASMGPGQDGVDYFSALAAVDLRTMEVYPYSTVLRPVAGDYFGFYTPGFETVQVSSIGGGGKIFVSCLNVDGSPLAERIAAATQDNLSSLLTSIRQNQDDLLEFLYESRKIFEMMMGN